MKDPVRLDLQPAGRALVVERGTPLSDALFAQGVEFPCGGRGRCRGCRVKVLAGEWQPGPEEAKALPPDELAAGWRLACQGQAGSDLTLELAQWEAPVLADDSVFAFHPRAGLGIAVDLGTTTLAAQLLDLATGHVLGVRTGLNVQARHGADIMSRLEYALRAGGQDVLERLIREQIGSLARDLLDAAGRSGKELQEVVVVGNTAMHHLFSGLDVEPLSRHPFEPASPGLQRFSATALGWAWGGDTPVCFLPCLGSFVGSDLLAGVLATGLHDSRDLAALVDLGTNGEIVVGTRERLLCASTAAGPAFEGARISCGMRAATGAISEVRVSDGRLRGHVIGGGTARGLCGSGLVDAVAAGLDLGLIESSGRLVRGPIALEEQVFLRAGDVRELQLAKGAIAAGLRLLVREWGAALTDVSALYLAGAFGNYINRSSARRIGLLQFPEEKIRPAGNTALLGAKLALFRGDGPADPVAGIGARVRHVSLNEDPEFHEIYVDEMRFPSA